jgi:hypothetical protein
MNPDSVSLEPEATTQRQLPVITVQFHLIMGIDYLSFVRVVPKERESRQISFHLEDDNRNLSEKSV